METKTESTTQTFQQTCSELENKRFLGEQMSKELLDIYDQADSSIEFLLIMNLNAKIALTSPGYTQEQLQSVKQLQPVLKAIVEDALNTSDHAMKTIINLYQGARLMLIDSCQTEENLQQIKQYKEIMEAFIINAFNTLDIEKLAAIKFDLKRVNKTPLMYYLAETGAETLFYKALERLMNDLSFKELDKIFEYIGYGYTGRGEDFNLASSLLCRGDHCYVRLQNFVVESLMKQSKFTEFLFHCYGEKQDLSLMLKSRQEDLKYNKPRYTKEDYIKLSCKYSNSDSPYDVKNKTAKEEYQKYVLDVNGQNLLINSMCNYLQVQIVLDKLMSIKNDTSLSLDKKQSVAFAYMQEQEVRLDSESTAILKSVVEYRSAEDGDLRYLAQTSAFYPGFFGSGVINNTDTSKEPGKTCVIQ